MQFYYPKLLQNKEIICPSPKVRRLIYKQLEINNIKFETQFIGYTNPQGQPLMNYKFNSKFIINLINHDRILRSTMNKYENFMDSFDTQSINIIFDKNADFNFRIQLLDRQLKYGYKLWSFIPVFKPIKKIIIK